jgi:hypothetical protein
LKSVETLMNTGVVGCVKLNNLNNLWF